MVSNHVKFMTQKTHLTSWCQLRKTVASINLKGNLVRTCSRKKNIDQRNNIKLAKETEGTLATKLNNENTSNEESVNGNEMQGRWGKWRKIIN